MEAGWFILNKWSYQYRAYAGKGAVIYQPIKGQDTITYERTPEWLASHNRAISSTSAPIQATDDPLQKMKQLKEMLDAGLISESEYNAKKADLLSRV